MKPKMSIKKWIVKMENGCEPWHCNERDCNQWATCKGPDPIANAYPMKESDYCKVEIPTADLIAELSRRANCGECKS